VIHRDLKPENIFLQSQQPSATLLSGDGEQEPSQIVASIASTIRQVCSLIPTVSDFSESLHFPEEANPNTEAEGHHFLIPYPTKGFAKGGAPVRLSPEIKQAQPGPKMMLDYRKNDAWALGLTLMAMMTNRREWIVVPAASAKELSETYSVGLRRVVQSLLVVNPTQRWNLRQAFEELTKLRKNCDHCVECGQRHTVIEYV